MIRMAYFPAHLFDSAAKRRDRIQSDAGTPPAFLVAIHIGRLHAGNLTSEARCASSRARSRVRVGSEIAVVQRECGQVVRTANVKTPLNDEKGCKKVQKCTLLHPHWFLCNRNNSFGKTGGDDETRTRDLCRDSHEAL